VKYQAFRALLSRLAGFVPKPARLCLVLIYVVAVIYLVDWLLFSRGFLWKVSPPIHSAGLPGDFSEKNWNSDFFAVSNMNREILRVNSSRKKGGDRVKVLFLGDSNVGEGVDPLQIKNLLSERFKDKRIRCYKLNCGGFRCYETPFVLDQIAGNSIDILVYGVFFGDFMETPVYPDAVQRLGIFWDNSLSVKNIRLGAMDDYVDEMLRRHWRLYRYKGWLKEFTYYCLVASYYRFYPLVSVTAGSGVSQDQHLQRWLETGDIAAYREYLDGIRPKVYMDFFLNAEHYEYGVADIETNMRYLEQMIATCKRKNIHLVTMHMPMNPILSKFGVHTTRKFVDSRLAPFWEKNNITFYDFSEHMGSNYFADFNHLNSEGREKFSLTLADMITDEISRNGIARSTAANSTTGSH
jgi:hypothetical protein